MVVFVCGCQCVGFQCHFFFENGFEGGVVFLFVFWVDLHKWFAEGFCDVSPWFFDCCLKYFSVFDCLVECCFAQFLCVFKGL